MTLPFTTNTVTIAEADDSGDKWEARTYVTSYTAVPCVIAFKDTVDATTSAGQQSTTQFTLFTDSDIAVTKGAQVTDDWTGDVYLVSWTQVRSGFGLDRRESGMRLVEGVG